jgi:hypothetical protein
MQMLTSVAARVAFSAILAVTAALAAAPSVRANAWQEILAVRPLPMAREWTTIAYDHTTNRLILFGGMTSCCLPRRDLWVLTGADGSGPDRPRWLRETPVIDLYRRVHSAAYSPVSNRLIVFGGTVRYPKNFNDTWILSHANAVTGDPAWSLLPIAPGPRPRPRADHLAAYDATSNRLVVFGGLAQAAGKPDTVLNDTWVLTNADGSGSVPSEWRKVPVSGSRPPPTFAGLAVYDAARNQLLIFGGRDLSEDDFNDVWVLSNVDGSMAVPASWRKRSPSGARPAPRYGLAGGYNPGNGRMVIFGGTDSSTAYNDTWLLANAFGAEPRWVQRSNVGGSPPSLSQMGYSYAATTDELFVSTGDLDAVCCTYTNRTFVLRDATR